MNNLYLQRARFGALSMFVSRAAALTTGLAFSAMIIKYLSAEDYGAYQIFLSVAATASLAASMSIPSIAARYIPEFLAKKEFRNLMILTLSIGVVRFVVLAILVVISYAAAGWLADFFNFTDFLRRWTLVIIIYAAVSQMGQTIGPILLGSYFEQAKLGIVEAVSSLARLVIMILVLQYDLGLGGVVLGLFGVEIALAFVYVALLLFVVRGVSEISRGPSPGFPSRRIFRFAAPSLILPFMGLLRSNYSDTFIIAHYLGIQSVGLYGFAFTVLRLGTGLNPVFLLNSQIEHILVRTSVEGDPVAVLARGHRILGTVSLAVSLPLVAVIALLREEVALAFGYGGTEATTILLFAGIYVLVNALRLAYGNIFTVLEAMRYRLYAGVFALYNLVAAIVLVQFFGLVGVAVATATASLFTLVFEHYVARERLGVPIGLYPRQTLKALVNVMIASIVILLAGLVLPTGIVGLLLGGALFITVYGMLSFYLRPVHPEDWELLKRAVFTKYGASTNEDPRGAKTATESSP